MKSFCIYRIAFVFLLLLLAFAGFGQKAKLAQQYYGDGEYEKAATIYQQLYEKGNNDYYFNRLVECYLAMESYDDCESLIKKQIKKRSNAPQLYVELGNLYDQQQRPELADEQYEKAIKKLKSNQRSIIQVASAFNRISKYELAIRTYETGSKLLNDDFIFSYQLGDLYRQKGNTPLMIRSYLSSLNENPGRISSLKTIFQRYLFTEEDFFELQSQLYERIQEDGDVVHYPELLTWAFIQQKDYKGALRQVKALDRKLEENGGRVFDLARIASNARDFETSIAAYDYIIDTKGATSSYYIEAKRASLECKRNMITDGFDYNKEDLQLLEAEYNSFLDEFGRNRATASIVIQLAELQAFYINDLEKAISLLSEVIEYQGLQPKIRDEAKLDLADFYLMKGERWESTLLYSQVDKEHKDDVLGHEARFKNAKLSYYVGDFEWAQTQFSVLKASTSKLIANDALDLSVFIMDNMGLDSTTEALSLYSNSDLLLFQNKFDSVFHRLNELQKIYPEHSLEDDLLYLKAQVYKKKRDYVSAGEMFEQIVENHKEEIRADNALYELARLYEGPLNDQEKAKLLYETLFMDFSGSTFAVDARKRFRKLRGDDI